MLTIGLQMASIFAFIKIKGKWEKFCPCIAEVTAKLAREGKKAQQNYINHFKSSDSTWDLQKSSARRWRYVVSGPELLPLEVIFLVYVILVLFLLATAGLIIRFQCCLFCWWLGPCSLWSDDVSVVYLFRRFIPVCLKVVFKKKG